MTARSFAAPGCTRAFTIVEVLAAMVFLGILLPVLMSALITANRAGVAAERATIATQLAENKLGELTLDNAWSSASANGDFGADWPGYRWALTKPAWQSGTNSGTSSDTVTELTLDVFYTVQGIEHSERLATLVDPSLSSNSSSSTSTSGTTP